MKRVRLTGFLFAAPLLAQCFLCNAQDISFAEERSEIRALPAGLDFQAQVTQERRAHERTGSTRGFTPNAVQQQNGESVVPELILGGEWTSVIKLTNRGTSPIPSTNVFFLDNLGRDMTATFQTTSGSTVTGHGFSFALNPGSIVEATFFGGSTSQYGHALIGICSASGACSSAGLYAEVTLRNRNSTRPDFESVFPLEQPAELQYMLFDYRAGLSETLYLVNENSTSTKVFLDFRNTSNGLIKSVTIPMDSATSQILTLHVLAPEIVGQQGTLVIDSVNSSGFVGRITATALRINPSNSFTPMRSFLPSK